ncbi:polyisoprenoid-binding protein [bacterium]|nr:polyisoprenoid-binding protein [bacterium]
MKRAFTAGLATAAAAIVLAACSPRGETSATTEGAATAGAPAAVTYAPLNVAAGPYTLDKTHASLLWKVDHQGLSKYTARFTHFDAALTLDPVAPEKSMITVTIDPKTVETDFAKQRAPGNTTDFNAELADEANFFNSAAFPTITFKSTSAERTGENTGKLTGDLTFLGVTKPVTLDVVYNGVFEDPRAQKYRVGFSATGQIIRSDFGMTFGQAFTGDAVDLLIEAEFLSEAPLAAAPQ